MDSVPVAGAIAEGPFIAGSRVDVSRGPVSLSSTATATLFAGQQRRCGLSACPELHHHQRMLEPPSPDEACTFGLEQLAFPASAAPAKALSRPVALLNEGQLRDVSGNPQSFFDLKNVVVIDVRGEGDSSR